MNNTELYEILNSLLHRPVTGMTDQELTLWLTACDVMERNVDPVKARRDWTGSRVEAEAETAHRKSRGAVAH
jgi:hypothetical protein